MKKLRCDEAEDLAAEYALGVLDGEARAAMIQHLETCARCRASVNDLAEVADLTLLLGPGAEPPADFEQRVLTAIADPATRGPAARPVAPRSRSWTARRVVFVAAACVALLAFLSVGVAVTLRDRDASTTATFRDSAGAEVGTATIKDGSPPSVFMTVTRDIGPSFGCEVVLENGQVVRLGDYNAGAGRSDWWGRLPAPREQVKEVRLLDGSGQVVATADVA